MATRVDIRVRVHRRPPASLPPVLSLLSLVLAGAVAHATTYYVATSGNDAGAGTMASPFRTIGKGVNVAQAGDTVLIGRGTYVGGIHPVRSGTASAPITFSAAPGDLVIVSGSGGDSAGFEPQSVVVQYIRVVGIAAQGFSSSGFSNGWNFPSSHIEIRDCIADGNGINGIAFYGKTSGSTVTATSVLIQNSIIAHNGNQQPSWSSGVNIYQVSGSYLDNQIIGNVSFENIDISTHHSDGSGFILDFGSTGALFENNIGFRNGGSCLRVTSSSGAHLINNTCYHDGLDPTDTAPAAPGEIYLSDATAATNVVASNNLLAAVDAMNAFNRTTGTGSTFQTNLAVNANGATPFFANPASVDFRITTGSSTVIDKATAAGAPTTDIGFDPKCIKAQSGQPVSWWQYAPDYTYIQSVGGVAGCFVPSTRPQGAASDIGAYESGGGALPGSGGATGTGGAAPGGAGGVSGTGGRAAGSGGAAAGTGGRTGSGGMPGGSGGATGTSGTGGAPTGSGGAPAATGGSPGVTGGGTSGGCACRTSSESNAGWSEIALLAAVALLTNRRSRRR